MTQVSIIIPVFNQYHYTKACLERLQSDAEVNEHAEVIVVDSGSSDETPLYLEELRSRWAALTKVPRLPKNQGFSLACNTGADHASSPHLLFLNNDTLPEGGWLSALLKSLTLAGAGIVGPKLLYPETRNVNHAGYVYNGALGGFYPIYHNYPENFQGVCRRRSFQALLGACVLMRRSLFNEVGGFSELGLEDIDLCFKVRDRGLRCIYEPRSVVLHHGSITLKNSEPGTIPPTSVHEFSERWDKSKILVDDERYYCEDGFTIDHISEKAVFLKETITSSFALLTKALEAHADNRLANAESLLREAITTFTGNADAHSELIEMLIAQERIEDAITSAVTMISHVSEAHQVQLLLAQLYLAKGQRQDARQVVDDLLADWTVSEDIRTLAAKLLEIRSGANI